MVLLIVLTSLNINLIALYIFSPPILFVHSELWAYKITALDGLNAGLEFGASAEY